MKDLTIIMPVYNVKDYIAQCIDSIKNQTYCDFYCYIVDDGCKDESVSIALNLIKDDPRFVVFHKQNGGLSDARNHVIDKVKTKYMTFIDSDDWLPLDYYEKMMEHAHQGCDLVVSDVNYVFDDSNKNFTLNGLCSWGNKSNQHKGILSPMFAWNKVYKSSLFSTYKLKYPKGLWYEDIPISTLLFAKSEQIGYANTHVFYRQREGSIMSETKTMRVGEIFTILQQVRETFDKYELSTSFHDEIEYLHIEHLCLYGMFRFLRNDYSNKWINQSKEVMSTYFLGYKHNPYLRYLPLKYRLFIRYPQLLKGFIH